MFKYFAIMSPVHGLKTIQATNLEAALDLFRARSGLPIGATPDVTWNVQYYACEHAKVRQLRQLGFAGTAEAFRAQISCPGVKASRPARR